MGEWIVPSRVVLIWSLTQGNTHSDKILVMWTMDITQFNYEYTTSSALETI
jgi:hypothetical protein